MHARLIRLWLSAITAALAMGAAGVAAAIAGPYDSIWVGQDSADRAAVLEALDAPNQIECNQTPLAEVLEKLKNKHHIEFQLDYKALEEAGVDCKSPVTIAVKDATLREALGLMLRPLELTWVIRDGALLVTTISMAETLSEVVIYPVDDLLFPPAEYRLPGRSYPPDYDSLIELIVSAVAPTSWEFSGAAPIAPFQGALLLPQTQDVHEQIADLFNQLRAARNAQFGNAKEQPPIAKLSDRQRAVDAAIAALQRPVELDLNEAGLEELATQISEQCKIPAAVDSKALEEAVIDAKHIRFTCRLTKLALHSALDHLLKQHELTWAIQEGVLLITTESASESMLETRVYKIGDLGEWGRLPSPPYFNFHRGQRPFIGFDSVLELVTMLVAPTTWSEVGGAGSIKPLASAGALVVTQTARAHLEVEQLLAAMHRHHAEHPQNPDETRGKPPDDDKLVMLTYRIPAGAGSEIEHVPTKTDDGKATIETRRVEPALAVRERIAKECANALPKLIAPDSWGAGGGDIQVVSDTLYIRQRPIVHEQIASMLSPSPMGGMGRPLAPP